MAALAVVLTIALGVYWLTRDSAREAGDPTGAQADGQPASASAAGVTPPDAGVAVPPRGKQDTRSTKADASELPDAANLEEIDDIGVLNRALKRADEKRRRYLDVIDRAPQQRERIASMEHPDAALAAFEQRLENAESTLREIDGRISQIEARLRTLR